MKHILITIVLISMFNNYPCSYASLCSEHQVDNKVKDKDLRDQANESSNEKKILPEENLLLPSNLERGFKKS